MDMEIYIFLMDLFSCLMLGVVNMLVSQLSVFSFDL
jgi:site-specific recombinase